MDTTDLDGINGRPVYVEFTHPLCAGCGELEERLVTAGHRVVTVDVSERPDLARKYGVALVPTAVAVGPEGDITARLAE